MQSMGSEESETTEQLHFHFSLSRIREGNGNPLQCSCLENHRDGGAWWAAICGVTQSQTRPKQLNSSSSTPLHCLERRHLRKKKENPLHVETTSTGAAGPWDIYMGSFCPFPILPNREVFSSFPLGVFILVLVHIMRTYSSVFPLEQGHHVLNLSKENIRTF